MDEEGNVSHAEWLERGDRNTDETGVDLDETQDELSWKSPGIVGGVQDGKSDGSPPDCDDNDDASSCEENSK